MRTLTRIAEDNGKTVPPGVLIAYQQVRLTMFYRAQRDEINKNALFFLFSFFFKYFTDSPWTVQRSLHCSVLEDNCSSVVHMVSTQDTALTSLVHVLE